MHPVHLLDRKALHQAVADHRPRARTPLLRRLKNDDRRPGEVTRLRQIPRRAEQHRGMSVVAARMHVSRRRGLVGQIVRLEDRQRVHIGAQADGLARASLAADHSDNAGPADAGDHLVAAERPEPLGDEPGGPVNVVTQLRMRMQIAPPFGELGMEIGDAVYGRHGSPRRDARCATR